MAEDRHLSNGLKLNALPESIAAGTTPILVYDERTEDSPYDDFFHRHPGERLAPAPTGQGTGLLT